MNDAFDQEMQNDEGSSGEERGASIWITISVDVRSLGNRPDLHEILPEIFLIDCSHIKYDSSGALPSIIWKVPYFIYFSSAS